MEYVALDFETANMTASSAVSIGLVRFDEEGEKINEYSSLIRPAILDFDPRCMAINGLDPFDIARAPSFSDIFPEVSSFVSDSLIVAHNAEFDIPVLRASFSSWGIEPFHNAYCCTLSLSRRLWPNRPSYKLTALSEEFLWEYKAHDALEDAYIAGRIFSKLMGDALFSEESFFKFMKRVYRGSRAPYPRMI